MYKVLYIEDLDVIWSTVPINKEQLNCISQCVEMTEDKPKNEEEETFNTLNIFIMFPETRRKKSPTLHLFQ